MSDLKKSKGLFARSLLRKNSEIKEDRALSILRKGEVFFKRQVEDIETEIQELEAEKLNLLDLSPTNSQSLVLASDFKPEVFYATYLRLSLKIREAKIRLEEAKKAFDELFVTPTESEPVEVGK